MLSYTDSEGLFFVFLVHFVGDARVGSGFTLPPDLIIGLSSSLPFHIIAPFFLNFPNCMSEVRVRKGGWSFVGEEMERESFGWWVAYWIC